MKLLYRGVEYDYTTPVIEVTEGEVGKYRGVDVRFRYLVNKPDHKQVTIKGLVYRGNRY